MKIASRTLSLLILVAIATIYVACKDKKGNDETEESIQLKKLRGVWNIQGATDPSDRSGDFDGLVLTIDGNYVENGTYSYSLTGERPSPSPWPASGTWKFGNPKSSNLVRDPGGVSETAMTYTVSDTELEIQFDIPEGSVGWPGGRISSVTGHWTFTFTK
jgi:hypothetical protein